MNKTPLISICIPAYKRIGYLRKLMDSVSIQTFKDYEVIITDDSPDDSVEMFISGLTEMPPIHYYRNEKNLGTPENWNESIRKASGTWIKLMHDDDWFADENSLQKYYEATLANKNCSFFFSAYNNVYVDGNSRQEVRLNFFGKFFLKQSPLNLYKKQFVGNPSCTLIKRDVGLYYDSNFKWVVDFEYYIRALRKVKSFYYIDEVLVNVGVNEDQVTKYTFRNPGVEIPENHLMIEKMGFNSLRNIFVYDHFWRLYRNLDVRDELVISKYYKAPLHPFLKQMISFQKKIPAEFLKKGVVSKSVMAISYLMSLLKRV